MRRPLCPVLTSRILVGAGSILFALAFSYPLLGHLATPGFAFDWNYTFEHAWAAWYSVMRLHQLPIWQPWRCGGYPLLAHPETRILTPFFLLTLLFGPIVGVHLEVIIHIAIGFAGAFLLGRIVAGPRLGAVACAITFMGSSWYYLHLAVGHAMFMSYVYAPWVVAFFWLSAEVPIIDYRRVGGPARDWVAVTCCMAASGVFLALIMFEGGTADILPHTVFLLGALALILSATRWSIRPLLVVVGIGMLGMAFSAIKWIPMLLTLGGLDRPEAATEFNPVTRLLGGAIFSRDQSLTHSIGAQWNFWEYGAYISPILALFAVVGLVSDFRRALPWLVLAALIFVAAMGNLGAYAPWPLLHHLPVWYEERIPSRFLILFTLCIAVLAALGVERLSDHRVIVACLLGVALVDCWMVGPPNLQWVLANPAPAGELRADMFDLNYVNSQIPCSAIRR